MERSIPSDSTTSDVFLRPAVSMKRYCMPCIIVVSSMVSRVVPGISLTIARLSPTMLFKSVDFPALV